MGTVLFFAYNFTMKETGTVIKIEDGKIEVAVGVRTMCKHCKAGCLERGKEMIVGCVSEIPVKPGDKVTIEVPDEFVLTTAVFAYGIPTLCFFAGLLISHYLFKLADVFSILIAISASIAGIFCSKFYFHKGKERLLTPKITEIL